ncbi:MAG: class I SAM-dependent methyltransferase [Verrucomicrobiota bacterium]|nr:class I SAM-dependent methyltransferase [Verrucomicrobiota bacterium]
MSKRLHLRITAAAEAAVKGGHPWIFNESVREQNRSGKTGELAIIFDRQNRFLGVGLFDNESPLRVRILHKGTPVQIDHSWWTSHLDKAVIFREKHFASDTTGYRLLHGENDGWPGLVLDRYGETLCLKLYTAAWFQWLPMIISVLSNRFPSKRIVLRLSRNIMSAAQQHDLTDGSIIFGEEIDEPVIFLENGLQFYSEVQKGQKTGFFLDQRENRQRVREISTGRKMLNVFSFSGGFALNAAAGGATQATDLDISAHALHAAENNFRLNANHPQISKCLHQTIQADAFEFLAASSNPKYDLIVLDPPSLAKRESERAEAIKAYAGLVRGALRQLQTPGCLVAASCSAHVSSDEFFQIVRATIAARNISFQEMGTTLHPVDHPARFKEAHYLKAIYLEVK